LRLDGEDVAFVASTNHMGKMWIVRTPTLKWPQCDYPFLAQDIICKHVMKIFKMLHPNIGDGLIVREIGTLHEVAQGGVVLEHNNHDYGIGNNDTRDDDPINE
jgi:hypothetical protein